MKKIVELSSYCPDTDFSERWITENQAREQSFLFMTQCLENLYPHVKFCEQVLYGSDNTIRKQRICVFTQFGEREKLN